MAANVEVDRQVGCLMSRMMLCHFALCYNFARIVKCSVEHSNKRNISMFKQYLSQNSRESGDA
eukprot:5721673-Ditylum_brightwellii.AAC.1